jgi:hypothetical protein
MGQYWRPWSCARTHKIRSWALDVWTDGWDSRLMLSAGAAHGVFPRKGTCESRGWTRQATRAVETAHPEDLGRLWVRRAKNPLARSRVKGRPALRAGELLPHSATNGWVQPNSARGEDFFGGDRHHNVVFRSHSSRAADTETLTEPLATRAGGISPRCRPRSGPNAQAIEPPPFVRATTDIQSATARFGPQGRPGEDPPGTANSVCAGLPVRGESEPVLTVPATIRNGGRCCQSRAGQS